VLRADLLRLERMNTTMHVFRAATLADEAAIAALLTRASLPLDGVHEMLTRDASQFVIAIEPTRPDTVIAIAAIEQCGEFALLRSVAVDAAFRGTGLGYAVTERVIALAQERRITELYLLTTTAAEFFPKFGFVRVARDSVPATVATTVEFASACPASATTMQLVLRAAYR
jgi:amino-acid N-acetyltransferase